MITRRLFLAAPALVRVASLMPISVWPVRFLEAREDAEIRDAAMRRMGNPNILLELLTRLDPAFRLKVGQMSGYGARLAINERFGLDVQNGTGREVASAFIAGIQRRMTNVV